MNSVGQSSLQFVKTVHLYKRERHLCLQVNMRIHVKDNHVAITNVQPYYYACAVGGALLPFGVK